MIGKTELREILRFSVKLCERTAATCDRREGISCSRENRIGHDELRFRRAARGVAFPLKRDRVLGGASQLESSRVRRCISRCTAPRRGATRNSSSAGARRDFGRGPRLRRAARETKKERREREREKRTRENTSGSYELRRKTVDYVCLTPHTSERPGVMFEHEK